MTLFAYFTSEPSCTVNALIRHCCRLDDIILFGLLMCLQFKLVSDLCAGTIFLINAFDLLIDINFLLLMVSAFE